MRSAMCLGCFLSALSVQAQDQPIAIYFVTNPSAFDAIAAETARVKQATLFRTLEARDKELQKAYGKKREEWPPDKRADRDAVQRAWHRAQFEYNFFSGLGLDPKKLQDLGAHVSLHLAKAEGVQLASTTADADLTVELLGCLAWAGTEGVAGVRLSAGGRLDNSLLATGTPSWTFQHGDSWQSTEAKAWTAEEPYWLIDVLHQPVGGNLGATCRKAGDRLVESLSKFAITNTPGLRSARKKAS